MAKAWIAKDVYYLAEPSYGTGTWNAPIMMVDAGGTEISGDITWEISDETLGYFEDHPDYPLPPSRRDFAPNKAGECIVTATYDGTPASARVVIFPTVRVDPGQTFDIDGDGTADYAVEQWAEGVILKFPHGATKTDLIAVPEPLGTLPTDFVTPAAIAVEFRANESCHIIVFNASGGAVYAGLFRTGLYASMITWRKLRDAA